jgi:ABC-type transport system involved in cytochrome c biogenesis permease component
LLSNVIIPLIVTNKTMMHFWLVFVPLFVILPLVKMIFSILAVSGILSKFDKLR